MSHSVQDVLTQLRQRAHARRSPEEMTAPHSMGDKVADRVVATVGSWSFVILQTALLAGWILFNAVSSHRVDPYPFVLLNLLLSFQAAYTAPIIMMSQNRQSEIDRRRSIDDFDINCKAELEIETLHQKIDELREREIALLSASVERLTRLLEAKQG